MAKLSKDAQILAKCNPEIARQAAQDELANDNQAYIWRARALGYDTMQEVQYVRARAIFARSASFMVREFLGA